jgi:hypothetical protein
MSQVENVRVRSHLATKTTVNVTELEYNVDKNVSVLTAEMVNLIAILLVRIILGWRYSNSR